MSRHLKADIFLLVITAIWGLSFPLMKNVLDFMPAFAYLSLRFFLAALVLIAIFYKSLFKLNRLTVLYSAVIGFLLFGGMAFQVFGLYSTKASNSAFITGLNVVMVPVVSALLLKKKPDIASILGVLIAFGGLFILSGGLTLSFNFGDLLTLICAIFWTFQIIFIDKFTEKQDAKAIAVLQMVFAALFNSMFWVAFERKPIEFNWTIVYTILITGILGTALAFAGQTIAQKYTTPTRTALIFTAEPVFGAAFAMIIPNAAGVTEKLQTFTVIGCILILVGMLFSEFDLFERKAVTEQV